MLPKGWEIKKLGEFGFFKNGINKAKEDFGFGTPFVNLLDVFDKNSISGKETFSLVNATESEIVNYNLQKGDVLFIRSSVKPSGVGLTAVIEDDFPGLIYSGFIIRFRETEQFLSLDFKKYVFFEDGFRNQLTNKSSVSANTNVNQVALASLEIKVPPLKEQIKISKILLAFDSAIQKLLQLVKMQEKRKLALLQKLLSGEIRFKGFNDQWSNETFGNTFSFLSTASYSRENLNYNPTKDSVYYIHYGDIHAKYAENIVDFSKEKDIPVLNENVKINATIDYLKDGDFILADASEDYEGVGKCIEIINLGKKKVIGGLHTFAARDLKGKTYKGFRPYIFQNHRVSNDLKKLATGSKVYGISKTNLSSLKLELPSIKEQAKIADILKSCDNEIKNLKLQLEKLQLQKQGLMQVLLTGKVRVKG